jgi:hypothetical protein
MNYFTADLLRDWKWWAKFGVGGIAILNVVDILSVTFAAPGFFNLWMVKITVAAALIGLVVFVVYELRHEKKSKQLEILLPAFIAERREYFEKMVAADPKFQTFCFECLHYDNERRCCSLRLYDREIKIKLQALDVFSYCLYWNLSDHPIMSLTESFVFKGDESTQLHDE